MTLQVKVITLLMIERKKKNILSYCYLDCIDINIRRIVRKSIRLIIMRILQIQHMDGQVLHVSQLYECVATFAILILLITEILLIKNQLFLHVYSIRVKEEDSENEWILSKQPIQQAPITPDLQKSAIQSLRNEMTEYEKKNNMYSKGEDIKEEKKQEKPEIIQYLTELNPSQKSVLLFYVQLNNFMSEHVPIILCILVLGMLTNSTRVFSLASFFCFLFTSLLFDFLHLQQRLKAQYRKGILLRRVLKIVSSCFIIGLFISYWCLGQYKY